MKKLASLRRILPAVVPWVTVVAMALHLPMPVRAVLVVASAAWAPGAAVAWMLESTDRLERLILIVALSLSASVIVSVILSMFHAMTGLRAVAVLGLLCVGSFVVEEIRVQPPLEPSVRPEDGGKGADR